MLNKTVFFIYFCKICGTLFFLICLTIFVIIFSLRKNENDLLKVGKTSEIRKDEPYVIIIDPGHGGIDGGAVSSSGIQEKDLNLKIAEYLREMCALSDKVVVMTRNEDKLLKPKYPGSLSLKRADLLARTEVVSNYESPVFVSIHQNKFSSSNCSGLQVFYSTNNNESFVLANYVKNSNRELLSPGNMREIKPAGSEIYVLDNIDCPAVLIECGFLSNPIEAKKLGTEEYQKKIAFVIYYSLMNFLEYKAI